MRKYSLTEKVIACYYTGIPLMIWGDPGVGKSSAIKYAASKLNKECEVLIASLREPSELQGYPIVDKTENIVNLSRPDYVKKLENGGLLFFDEITTCNKGIQAVLLNIILDGKVGDYELKNVYRLAAGNYTNVFGNNEMSLALANRFIHVFAKADAASYADMMDKGFKFEFASIVSNKDDIKLYEHKKLEYRTLISNFIRANPQYLFSMPDVVEDPTEVAYPTPRSWTYVLEIMATLDGNEDDLIKELMYGAIGKTAANEFFRYKTKFYKECINILDHVDDFTTLKLEYRANIARYMLNSFLTYLRSKHKELEEFCYWYMKKCYENGLSSLVMGYIKDISTALCVCCEIPQERILTEFAFVKDLIKYL